METLSHERSFAILNLNHCGIESLQGFLCVHLRVCMCERGGARPRGPGCVFKDLKTCMGFVFLFLFCMHTRSHLIFFVSPSHVCIRAPRARTHFTVHRAQPQKERKPLLWKHTRNCTCFFFPCAAEVRSRGADLHSSALDFSPNTCLVGSFSYTSRGVGKDAANSNTEGGFLFLSYYRLARPSRAHLRTFRNEAPLRFSGLEFSPKCAVQSPVFDACWQHITELTCQHNLGQQSRNFHRDNEGF